MPTTKARTTHSPAQNALPSRHSPANTAVPGPAFDAAPQPASSQPASNSPPATISIHQAHRLDRISHPRDNPTESALHATLHASARLRQGDGITPPVGGNYPASLAPSASRAGQWRMCAARQLSTPGDCDAHAQRQHLGQ